MKYLYLIRHAKSSHEESGISDFERKLTEKGKADALKIGEALRQRECRIDTMLCSPAKRTKKTCVLMTDSLHISQEVIHFDEKIYLATAETLEKCISQYDGTAPALALVGHNPGITDLANSLCDNVHIDNLPTAGVFAVSANISDWQEFPSAKKEFLFFLQPKLM